MFIFIVELIFSLRLFVNVALFVPQIIKLYKTKNAEGISLLTFSGFVFIQFFTFLHGYIKHDYLLMIDYIFSLLTCGTATIMIIFYRLKKDN